MRGRGAPLKKQLNVGNPGGCDKGRKKYFICNLKRNPQPSKRLRIILQRILKIFMSLDVADMTQEDYLVKIVKIILTLRKIISSLSLSLKFCYLFVIFVRGGF